MINLAVLFPGQGSQFVGMLGELAARYPLLTDYFALVSDRVGYDVWQLTQEGPDTQLNQTEYTQVAMLTADVAVFRLLEKLGLRKAQIMAGHSLGEYAALVCANAITLPDAAQLVAKRGQLMQNSVPLGQGAMAAIVGLSNEQVQTICAQASASDKLVSPANYNALGQIVIAGHTEAVERAVVLSNEMEAKLAKIIPVSVPCHCPLLTEAAEAFAAYLAQTEFKTPETMVISNVDLSSYKSPAQIRNLLEEQLYKPVRWVETVQLIKNKGVNFVIECGPGKVLSGLVKRIERTLPTISVNDKTSLDQVLERFTA